MRNIFPVLIIVMVLSGCAELNAFRSGIATHGADASDQTLETAIWGICNGIPVGAINRRFKSNDERQAYSVLCPENGIPHVIETEIED